MLAGKGPLTTLSPSTSPSALSGDGRDERGEEELP